MEHLTRKYSQGEWVAAVNNSFWLNYVYLFSVSIKFFQWLLPKYRGTAYWKKNHALRIKDGIVYEMLAGGLTPTPLEEWVKKQRRTVAIFQPLVPFREVEPKPYAVFDILQLVLHWIRQSLNIGNKWNGKDGVPKKREGYFCSEEVALSLGRTDAHLILPCQLFELEELRYVETFTT